MNQIEFWKNFKLGTELQLSGTFIYNGLYCLDQMETFYYEEEIFEFLYQISVGIERLQKIVLIIHENFEVTNIDKFEESLITHSHVELNSRIQKIKKTNYSKNHNKFLTLLTEFYKTVRYERYSIKSIFSKNDERTKLVKFVQDAMQIEICTNIMGTTPIDNKTRQFFAKLIDRIINPLWELVDKKTTELRIHTTELGYQSKAFKIFRLRELTFENENHLKRELLLSIIKKKMSPGINKLMETIEPVDFEMYHSNYYVRSLFHHQKSRRALDELEEHFAIEEIGYNRVKDMKFIGEEFSVDHYGEDE